MTLIIKESSLMLLTRVVDVAMERNRMDDPETIQEASIISFLSLVVVSSSSPVPAGEKNTGSNSSMVMSSSSSSATSSISSSSL